MRWSHSCINSNMMFGQGGIDGESIFKLVDHLHRRVLGCSATPWTICSLSNRRLTAFLKAGELLVDARLCFHASFKSLMMAVFCYDRCLNSWLPEVLAAWSFGCPKSWLFWMRGQLSRNLAAWSPQLRSLSVWNQATDTMSPSRVHGCWPKTLPESWRMQELISRVCSKASMLDAGFNCKRCAWRSTTTALHYKYCCLCCQ